MLVLIRCVFYFLTEGLNVKQLATIIKTISKTCLKDEKEMSKSYHKGVQNLSKSYQMIDWLLKDVLLNTLWTSHY